MMGPSPVSNRKINDAKDVPFLWDQSCLLFRSRFQPDANAINDSDRDRRSL